MGINLNPENCQSSPTSSQICLKPQFPFFLLPHAPERNQIRAHGWHGNERGRERCRWRIDEVSQCRVGGGASSLAWRSGGDKRRLPRLGLYSGESLSKKDYSPTRQPQRVSTCAYEEPFPPTPSAHRGQKAAPLPPGHRCGVPPSQRSRPPDLPRSEGRLKRPGRSDLSPRPPGGAGALRGPLPARADCARRLPGARPRCGAIPGAEAPPPSR